MKKLLMLLVFSATTFASAQRHITVVQLEASTGSTSVTYQRIAHVYAGDREFDIPYGSDYRKVSTTTYTLNLNPTPSSFDYDGDSYIASVPFLQNTQATYSSLGRNGRFLVPGNSRIQIDPELVLNIDPYQVLLDNGWRVGTGVTRGNRWNFYPANCDYRFQVSVEGNGYAVTEIGPGYDRVLALIARDEPYQTVSGRPAAIATSSEYESLFGGSLWLNLEEIAEAVRIRAEEVCNLCVSTSSTIDAKYALLNDGRTFSDYIPGVTDWIPTGLTNTEWNYVVDRRYHHEIHENTLAGTFTLYVNLLSGEGRNINLQTPRTFNCLEDLIAVLPQ